MRLKLYSLNSWTNISCDIKIFTLWQKFIAASHDSYKRLERQHGTGDGFFTAAINKAALGVKSHLFPFLEHTHGAIGAGHHGDCKCLCHKSRVFLRYGVSDVVLENHACG